MMATDGKIELVTVAKLAVKKSVEAAMTVLAATGLQMAKPTTAISSIAMCVPRASVTSNIVQACNK